MMRTALIVTCIFLMAGCASGGLFLGDQKFHAPPEFNQKVMLRVSDEYVMYQAPRSGYDIGDLQSFHSQHTLPIVIKGAFKEMFGQVEMVQEGPKIDMAAPDVPAVFEVRILDLAHDIYNEATRYRSEVVLAVVMKSPRGHIFWSRSFRGRGVAKVDPQFSTGMGPEEAILDAMRDAIDQMQEAILASPEVRTQLKYYRQIEQARKEREAKV